MQADNPFQFQFSLEILNHLGRGLYRSFATVIAEAVSNSWDAEAKRVDVTITEDSLTVEDDGKGMSAAEFQDRFLKVGYSRRIDATNKSSREVIGRKGIGKLAMLSVSEKVTILSKKEDGLVIGGKINNPELDKKIKDEGKYSLDVLSDEEKEKLFDSKKSSGTKIIFEKIKTHVNSEDIIRKYLATQFNFIFTLTAKDSFEIYVNNKKVTEDDLKELNENTQFVWFLGEKDEKKILSYKNLQEHRVITDNKFYFNEQEIEIRGFIASVKLPQHLLLRGSGGDFKASVNLFCNGRLRQENLFQEITSKRITEEYLYGEIHVDGFEDEEIDRFTSSREGIIKDDPLYQTFLKELKKIQVVILNDWDPWRRKQRDEGDIDAGTIPKYQKRLEDSQNWRERDFEDKIDATISDGDTSKTLKDKMRKLSSKNTIVYQDLFILENIFREYIKLKGIDETIFDLTDPDQKKLAEDINKTRIARAADEATHALKGKIVNGEHYLNYTDLWSLASIVDIANVKKDKKGTPRKYRKELCADVREINPVRNPIMHTNEITDDVMNWPKLKNLIDYLDELNDK